MKIAHVFFSVSCWITGLALPCVSAQSAPAQSGVQIVNATSVPEIALYVNKRLFYPSFLQGLFTGDAWVPSTSAAYRAVFTKDGVSSKEVPISFVANQKQTLLVTGDFTVTDPPAELPQPSSSNASSSPTPSPKTFEPNVQFRLLSHLLDQGEERLRYRFFNAMPRKEMEVHKEKGPSGDLVLPGKMVILSGQSTYENYIVNVDGKSITVMMRQEGETRNCTIVFFLKNGLPSFTRVFEDAAG